jgi:hypothetical protein
VLTSLMLSWRIGAAADRIGLPRRIIGESEARVRGDHCPLGELYCVLVTRLLPVPMSGGRKSGDAKRF